MSLTPRGSRTSQDPRDPSSPALHDVDVDTLTFVNKKAQITVTVASCKLERTIEGASSLIVTIHDPDLKFLNSLAIDGGKATGPEAVGRKLESFVTLDNLVWALAGIHIQPGHVVEATLEDEAVYRLRQFTSPLTMSRGKATRAEFIKHMFDEAGVELVCPELEDKQPIAKPGEEEAAKRDRKRKPGIAGHAKITIKSQPPDAEQLENLEVALNQAVKDHAGALPTLALVCAGIGESDFRKTATDGVYGTHHGVFQSDTIPGDQVARQAHYFLVGGESFQAGGAIHLAASDPHLTPGDIATKVEASGEPGEFYNVYRAEAEAIVEAFTGENGQLLAGTKTYAKEYQFRRGGPNGEHEDSWTAGRRLAEEVNWYLFIVAGTGYLITGERLLHSRSRMLIKPGMTGLTGHPTGGQMTSGAYTDQVTVTCHAAAWEAPPGTAVELEGCGTLDERWVVATIERPSMKSSTTVITLGRPKKKKKEPAHEVGTRSTASEEPLVSDPAIASKLAKEHPELKAGVREVVAAILTKYPQLQITSTTSGTHASHSLHYEGRAADLAGPDMNTIGTWIAQNLTAKLTEGIHNPTLSVKDGKAVPASFWGGQVWSEHLNHIHVGV